MNYSIWLFILALISIALTASAQTNAPISMPAAPAPITAKPLVFHAPAGDFGTVSALRVCGGSRCGGNPDFLVEALVPDQPALTTQAQPSLYWCLTGVANTPFEITITEPKNPKPILAMKSAANVPAGIHAIRLTKFNVSLKPDVVYRWTVAAVVDPENRSLDIVTNGVIKRIQPSAEMASKLDMASDSDKPAIYAANGFWYDALQLISDQIERAPQDASLRNARVSLLQQVGLDGAEIDAASPKSP